MNLLPVIDKHKLCGGIMLFVFGAQLALYCSFCEMNLYQSRPPYDELFQNKAINPLMLMLTMVVAVGWALITRH